MLLTHQFTVYWIKVCLSHFFVTETRDWALITEKRPALFGLIVTVHSQLAPGGKQQRGGREAAKSCSSLGHQEAQSKRDLGL